MRRQRGRVGLMAAALVGVMASGAVADVTTERSASILVFPKVIADGTRDTIIQITNTSNSMVHAHCFYVNGALTFPDQPAGPNNPPLWTEIDFDIWLTKQQPTHWVVSEGRLVDPEDYPCSNAMNIFDCNNAGIDPGRVPPVSGAEAEESRAGPGESGVAGPRSATGATSGGRRACGQASGGTVFEG